VDKYLKTNIYLIYMDLSLPNQNGFTIYSKSGCPNCTSVKKLIKDNLFFYTEINCDEYILEYKEEFLTFIENIANVSYKTFPMVFYDGKFIGGLTHTREFINKLLLNEDKKLLSFEDNF
jgi:glutaredoxin